ncbi:MAG TPA: hydrogenase maturation protease [Spirochaetota bacterium]|nr:hydrogenase maturation protease [Spirochaetota bacterium]
MKKEILVVGVGNILQRDEGLGVHALAYIERERKRFPRTVEFLDGGTAGYDLIPSMKGKRKIIFIDALKAEAPPGSVFRFPAERLSTAPMFSLHDAGVSTIVQMLRIEGERPEIEIIGVVPEDIASIDIGITEPVQRALPLVLEQVFDAVTTT